MRRAVGPANEVAREASRCGGGIAADVSYLGKVRGRRLESWSRDVEGDARRPLRTFVNSSRKELASDGEPRRLGEDSSQGLSGH